MSARQAGLAEDQYLDETVKQFQVQISAAAAEYKLDHIPEERRQPYRSYMEQQALLLLEFGSRDARKTKKLQGGAMTPADRFCGELEKQISKLDYEGAMRILRKLNALSYDILNRKYSMSS
jgi:hypothetical protein